MTTVTIALPTGAGHDRLAGHSIIGATARGALVEGEEPGSTGLGALLLPRAEADAALQNGLAVLPPHDHRERLVDLAVDPRGVVLLTSPAVVSTLERLLASERSLAPGVVVTILAPVVDALRDASAHGVHLAPGAEAVGFSSDGRPVLLVSAAEPASGPFGSLVAARTLLARCRERCPDWPGGPEQDDDLEGLVARLYRAAEPLPLGDLLESEPVQAVHRRPAEAPGADRRAARERAAMRRAVRLLLGRPIARRAQIARSETGSSGRHRRPHPVDDWRTRVVTVARKRRGPVTAAAVILLGSVAAATVGGGQPGGSAPSPPPRPSASSSPRASAVVDAPPPETAAEDAARSLVSAAVDCSPDASACVDGLTTGDSPLRQDDGDRFARLLPAEVAVTAIVVDVNGASALVTLDSAAGTTAASVLMIRTEAGWLIRDVFAEGRS